MVVKKTFSDLRTMNDKWKKLIRVNPKLENTKFGYAMQRFVDKNLVKIFKLYNAELNAINIDNALVNKDTGEILYNMPGIGREFKFDKAGLKKVLQEEMELDNRWDDKECEVEPFFAEVPPILKDENLEIFNGLIIKTNTK